MRKLKGEIEDHFIAVLTFLTFANDHIGLFSLQ